jgi:uncharacterized protein
MKQAQQFLIVLVGLFSISLSIFFVKDIKPFKITSLLDKNHPIRRKFENYSKYFSDERRAFYIVESLPKTPIKDTLDFIQLVKINFKHSLGVKKISTIHDWEYFDFNDNYLSLRPFITNGDFSPKSIQKLNEGPYKDQILNSNKTHFLNSLEFKENITGKKEIYAIDEILTISAKLKSEYPAFKIHFMGTKIGKYHFLKEMINNQKIIMPILIIALAILVFYLFRSITIILWFFYIMAIAYSITLLAIIFIEGGLNPYNSLSLFFVLIVATSDLVHFFMSYLKYRQEDIRSTLSKVRNDIFWPCWLTTLTTCIGFASLYFNNLLPIRNFGLYCALGSLTCFLLTFYLLPLALKAFPLKSGKTQKIFLQVLFDSLFKRSRKSPSLIIHIFLWPSLLLFYMSFQLRIDDEFHNKFQEDHPFSTSMKEFQKEFQFVGSLDILIHLDSEISKSENLKKVNSLEEEILKLKGVVRSSGTLKWTQYFQSLYQENSLSQIEKRVKSSLNLLLDYEVLPNYQEKKSYHYNFTFFINETSTLKLMQLVDKIKLISSQAKYNNLKVEPSGYYTIRSHLFTTIVKSFLYSFALTLLLIWPIFLFLFRSLSWSLLALIPNIAPLIFVSGMMAILKINVESNLVMIACISFGIAVDDTVHFLTKLRSNLYLGKNLNDSISDAYHHTSRALVGTTLVFLLSFPCFYFADLKLFKQIGLLISGAMITALLADFLLLPAILDYLDRFLNLSSKLKNQELKGQ